MLKTIQNCFLFLTLLWCSERSLAQNFTASIDTAFQSFINRPPNEKLYLHMDRNIYATGGTIWFRGYLVNANSNLPNAMSNFIYVELYDQSDSLVCRKKIKKIDGVFSGNIKLDAGLPEGSYFIRAYSTWMLNAGIDEVFHKAIHIGNLQTHKITSKIEFSEKDADQKTASIYFADKNGDPISGTRVKCTLYLGHSKAVVLTRRTGDDGRISFDLDQENKGSSNQFIEVEFENSQMEYSNKFFLEKEDGGQLDVQFFPEGGDLIDGVGNRVAFKAIGIDGFSREVQGIVLNSENDTVTTFSSQHLGMGSFYLVPETGEEYHAEIRDAENNVVIVPLPDHLRKGAALSVVNSKKSILLNVRQQDFSVVDSCFIMLHAGDKLVLTRKLDDPFYEVSKDILPEGIVNFVLLNDKKEAISSRMVFIRKKSKTKLTVTPNKENYQRRDKVSLNLSVFQKDTTFHTGSFSIAVTDDLVVEIDSLSDNIRSNLLLTSDLKGNIENPGFYFLNSADSTNFYLDLLMLTQGWKRFDVNELLQHGLPPAKYYLELGQTISGKYEKMLMYRKKFVEITALSIDPLISASTYIDENSNFIFNKLDFPDSTLFTVHAQRFTNIKQEPAGLIIFDKDTFPSFHHTGLIPERTVGYTGKMLENATERVYYEDGGKMVVLDAIEVEAYDKSKHLLEIKYGISSNVYDKDRIEKFFPVPRSIRDVLFSLPGVFVTGNSVRLSGCRSAPLILLDGMELDLDALRDVYSDNIDHIAVITGPGAMLYSRGGGGEGGVLIINLREGGDYKYKLKGVKQVMPLGYQKPVEFYVPKYEIDSIRIAKQPDMRSTVFWEPNITVESGQETTVSFYAADPSTTYTYIIEGIDDIGHVYRSVGKLRREDE